MPGNLPQLHDVILPASPGWWPLPWTAWLLILLCLLAAVALLYTGLRLWKRLRTRQQLSRAWQEALKVSLARGENLADSVNCFLKRLSIQYRNPATGNWSQETWSDFLQSQIPDSQQALLRQMLEERYQAHSNLSQEQASALVQSCIRRWL